jgi:hypothetical protein
MGMIEPEDDPQELPNHQSIIENLPSKIFVEQWRRLVGEPPAVMLESRRLMLALLVESVPAKSLAPEGNPPILSASKLAEDAATGKQVHP